MNYNVFISYSSKDLPIVDEIKEKLNYQYINVFISEYSISPGEPLIEKIIKNIKKCDIFILLWSPAAKKSDCTFKLGA
jgi:predicted nucleotide-binding protein